MSERALLITGRVEPTEAPRMVEICRSFAFKLNVGNYESRDFFCSQKASCTADQAESVSSDLDQFCFVQVMKAVTDYQRLRKRELEKRQSS